MKGDDAKILNWMIGSTKCEANLYVFAEVLGYPFNGSTPIGTVFTFREGPIRTSWLLCMVWPGGIIGTTTGLLPLYDQLVRIFRENIALSGGNNDDIRSSLVNLLCLAQDCASCEDPDMDFTLDVMDFIFNEIYDAMVGKTTFSICPLSHVAHQVDSER